jgi:acyl carrier protein
MQAETEIEDALVNLLRSHASLAAGRSLPGHLLLGAGGLGLDSIAMVELLLDCEQRFGVDTTELLEGAPLTMGRLLAHIRGAVAE